MAIKNHRQKLLLALLFGKTNGSTRMHSSRMRTGRSLTVCRSLLRGGGSVPRGCLLPGGSVCFGGSAPGGCLLWGVSAQGGVWSQGVSAPGGVSSGGLSAPRGVSAPGDCLLGGCLLWEGGVCSGGGVSPACTEADTPPLWTESQTPVKTLPWPNFVAAGNYYS